jgi:hypothetical protein
LQAVESQKFFYDVLLKKYRLELDTDADIVRGDQANTRITAFFQKCGFNKVRVMQVCIPNNWQDIPLGKVPMQIGRFRTPLDLPHSVCL